MPTHPSTDVAAAQDVPGDGGLPLLGHSLATMRDPIAFAARRRRRYGDVSWMSAFGKRFITLLGPEANRFVLANRNQDFASDAWEYLLSDFFHRGLMLLDFDEHRLHRRVMQSAFRREAMEAYLEQLQPSIQAAWMPGSPRREYRKYKRPFPSS